MRGLILILCCLLIAVALGQQAAEEHPGAEIEERLGVEIPTGVIVRDETGQTLALDRLAGKPMVLSLIYFNCTGTCTPLISRIVDGLNAGALPAEDLHLVTLSINQLDTPEMAAGKKGNYLSLLKIAHDSLVWNWLTGDAEDIRRLTNPIGFRFFATGNNTFAHPAGLFFFNPRGKLVRVLHGLNFSDRDLRLAAAECFPYTERSISDLLTLSYMTYDPDARGYVFDWRLPGYILLPLAVGLLILLLWLWYSRRLVERRIRIVRYDEPV
ncbi:MAG TPA: SCO family protein [Calditrichia bacterium]|nr:SCO family protein [Calditrichia bacterium]